MPPLVDTVTHLNSASVNTHIHLYQLELEFSQIRKSSCWVLKVAKGDGSLKTKELECMKACFAFSCVLARWFRKILELVISCNQTYTNRKHLKIFSVLKTSLIL